MKISEVYSKSQIPPNLQTHMLTVAAVGVFLSENWKTGVDVNLVRRVLLIHDLAKIINFDFTHSKYLLGQEAKESSKWEQVQREIVEKYGRNEEVAVLKMATELGLSSQEQFVLAEMSEVNFAHHIEEGNNELKICFYSDFRVAPSGVTSITARLDELITRSQKRGVSKSEIERLEGIKIYCLNLERQLQELVKIPLSKIPDQAIVSVIAKLQNEDF